MHAFGGEIQQFQHQLIDQLHYGIYALEMYLFSLFEITQLQYLTCTLNLVIHIG